MKTISFINLKGGVGKTTIVTNAAFALANFWGARVLVIDNDKQGNASLFFGGNPKKATLTNLLLDGASAKACIQPTRYTPEWFVKRRRDQRKTVHFRDAQIDIIASDMGLMEANLAKLEDKEETQDDILKNALGEVADDYSVCLIDNPPDINISVLNALVASDSVIIVSTPDAYSVQGVYEMAGMIE
ncbi:MAG: AAA family ATPase, partial [Schwartzia sp.]|nr:AAA family ATPase [Schwartzia sp. (in: firmicutes)]